MRHTGRVTMVATAITIALAACGDAKVDTTTDGRIRVEGTGARARPTITDSRGGEITYNQRTLPGGFPGSVPRPAGLALQRVASGDPAGTAFFQLTYEVPTTTTAADALAAYRVALVDAGFTVAAETGGTDRLLTTGTGPGWRVTAASLVDGPGAPSTLIVTVQPA